MPREPLTHVCPACDGEPDTHCWCDGRGAVTAAAAASWAADGEPMPRELPPVPKRMARPCADCAFRRGSPEREDFRALVGLAEAVDEGRPFHCHTGMSVDAHGRHVPRAGLVDGKPIGHPICAGWATARRRRARGLPLVRVMRPVGRAPFREADDAPA